MFLQGLILIFGATNQFSEIFTYCCPKLGPKRTFFEDIWINMMRSSEVANWTNRQTTGLEKRKSASESSLKTTGSILKSLQVFLVVPPSKSRIT